MEGDVYVKIK